MFISRGRFGPYWRCSGCGATARAHAWQLRVRDPRVGDLLDAPPRPEHVTGVLGQKMVLPTRAATRSAASARGGGVLGAA